MSDAAFMLVSATGTVVLSVIFYEMLSGAKTIFDRLRHH